MPTKFSSIVSAKDEGDSLQIKKANSMSCGTLDNDSFCTKTPRKNQKFAKHQTISFHKFNSVKSPEKANSIDSPLGNPKDFKKFGNGESSCKYLFKVTPSTPSFVPRSLRENTVSQPHNLSVFAKNTRGKSNMVPKSMSSKISSQFSSKRDLNTTDKINENVQFDDIILNKISDIVVLFDSNCNV